MSDNEKVKRKIYFSETKLVAKSGSDVYCCEGCYTMWRK